ncbi:hypothetical protein CSPAE12_03629 [Colletotrichum incanum]|nr:hypothetical protein CSPAE12_03629 [Colletotrichum incanum]
MIGLPANYRETFSQFDAWAKSTSDILSIGQIAEFAEVQSVIIYRMILELPSMTMFAYLCDYIRIERKQSLVPLLEKWFDDTRLEQLWWDGRPKIYKIGQQGKGLAITVRRHKALLSQTIIEAEYRCQSQILRGLKQPVSDCLERELDFPDTDRIRACILNTVRSSWEQSDLTGGKPTHCVQCECTNNVAQTGRRSWSWIRFSLFVRPLHMLTNYCLVDHFRAS